jgi:hypothetical protein
MKKLKNHQYKAEIFIIVNELWKKRKIWNKQQKEMPPHSNRQHNLDMNGILNQAKNLVQELKK